MRRSLLKGGLLRVVAVAALAAGLSCTGEREAVPVAEEAPAAAIEQAEAAAQALGRELRKRLLAELEAGGPASAVRVCAEVAQELAAAHSTGGVTVRRVSLKARNPADRPDEFERRALLDLAERLGQGLLPTEITEVEGSGERRRLRYLRPIVVTPPCLICHGPDESLDSEVAKAIAERYPEDEATGYANGDLRGAFSVTVELD